MSKYQVPGEIVSAGVRLTAEGGIASKFENHTGAAIPHGSAVSCSPNHDKSVILQNNEYDTIGFAYGEIPDGGSGWVVTCGIAEALFENANAPIRGYWVKAAPTDGRVVAAVAPSGVSAIAAAAHFREVGHCMQSKSAGTDVLAFIVVHPL